MKRTIVNLTWLLIGLANIGIGYFLIYQWAYWHVGGIVEIGIGLVLAADAASKLRRPKVIKFNHIKGVRYV